MGYHKSRKERYQIQKRKKRRQIILSLVLITIIGIGGTYAYLTDTTETLINTFFPAKVEVEVKEDFNQDEDEIDNIKKNITVKNIGNTDAYIRVKLVSYRVNDKNERIGGKASVPDFYHNANWIKDDQFYYYKLPISANDSAKGLLPGTGILLKSNYDDADGGKQVIEVMAEGIQATPKEAVKEAWGLQVGSDGHLFEPDPKEVKIDE